MIMLDFQNVENNGGLNYILKRSITFENYSTLFVPLQLFFQPFPPKVLHCSHVSPKFANPSSVVKLCRSSPHLRFLNLDLSIVITGVSNH